MTDRAQAEAQLRAAIADLRRGAASEARAALEALCGDGSPIPPPFFLLAQACRMAGDAAGEGAALDRQLALHPGHLGALLMKGQQASAAGNDSAAETHFRRALAAAATDMVPDALRADLQRAAAWLDQQGRQRLERVEQALAEGGFPAGRHSPRIAEALAILRGEAPVQLQQPTNFYVPGLAQRAFWERDEFDWLPAFEAETVRIRAELDALLASPATGFSPYIPAGAAVKGQAPNAHLVGDAGWSSFDLLKHGAPVPGQAERCPATLAALALAPQPLVPGHSPFALFSRLRPGTHIRPHHGLYNHRLICHLPLIVPDGCVLRVGNHQRQWVEGEMLVFDDSVEHEAANRGTAERVVLLFEVWKPELCEADREALTLILAATPSPAEH